MAHCSRLSVQWDAATSSPTYPPACPAAQSCYLNVFHILLTHMAWEREDTVLAKAC